MPTAKAWFAAALTACVCSATSAQSLDGLDVHGHFDVPTMALFDVIDRVETVRAGEEFRYEGFGGAYLSADLQGDILTLAYFNADQEWQGEEPSWRFELTGDYRFTSFELVSQSFPKPVTFLGIDEQGEAAFVLPKWERGFDNPGLPNTLYTSTWRVTHSGQAAPIPEPATYALMLAGLAGLGVAGNATRKPSRRGR